MTMNEDLSTLMTILQELEVRPCYHVAMGVNNTRLFPVDIYIVDTVSALPFRLSPSEMLKTLHAGRPSQPP